MSEAWVGVDMSFSLMGLVLGLHGEGLIVERDFFKDILCIVYIDRLS